MSSFNEFNSPVISQIRSGSETDPYVLKQETHQVVNGKVVLSEIPDQIQKVTVTGDNKTWYEAKTVTANNYYSVDYTLGVVTFDSSNNGKTLTFNFHGRGAQYFPTDRVYTKQENGVVTETLQKLVTDTTAAKDSANNSADTLEHKGVYDNATQYYKRNIVTYETTSYMATEDVIGVLPTDDTKWKKISGFDYKGVYSAGATYQKGDIVKDSVNEEVFVSLTNNNLNNPLSDNTKWELMITVKDAVANANTKADLAQSKADLVQAKLDEATTKIAETEAKRQEVITATNNAITATTDANNAADNANTKTAQFEQVVNDSKKIYKGLVATYADLATQYPSPQIGWTVYVKSNQIEYRWDGTQWTELIYFSGTSTNFLVKTLHNTVTIQSAQSNVNIGITQFNPADDSLLVYRNSTYMALNTDYTIAGDGLSIFHINSPSGTWDANTEFNFVVFKNANRDVPSADGSLIQSGSITDDKLATGIKISPALTDKDGFTHASLKARLDDLEATPNSEYWNATADQTVFTLSNGNYQVGKKVLHVIVGGIPQVSGLHFTETSSTSFTLSEGVPANTLVYAYWLEGHVALTVGHNHTHGKGGQDEINISSLAGYEAVTSLQSDMTTAQGDISTLKTDVGTKTNLQTTDKSSLVGAINEHDNNIGDLTNSKTNTQTDLISIANEIHIKEMFPDQGVIRLDGMTIGDMILTRTKAILGTVTLA